MTSQPIRRKLLKRRRFRLLISVLLGVCLLFGVLIVHIERPNGGMITSYLDGIWWVTSTITTVGYGDEVPITAPGRVLGMILQLMGALMYGSLIAMVGSHVNRAQEEFYWGRLFDRMDRLERILDDLSKQTGYIVKNGNDENEGKLSDNDV